LTGKIRVFNSLSKIKEPLETVEPGRVGIYLCGPTVYKPSHIGHMVGPVIFDTVKRYLVYCGYQVKLVVNITDIDDKLIHESAARNMTLAQLAEEMTADYFNNLREMGVDTIDHSPRATEFIGEIIGFVEALIERGFAYAAEGDVYFDVSRDPQYGKLSHRSLDSMQGEGGDMAGRKRNAADFALWKGAKPGEPSWPSPWGPGRPGWHIECSAMSRALLGQTFDIHGGGLDLLFPHHENEIAQSECCHGTAMARYWMHNGLMQAADEVGKVGGRNTRTAEAGAAVDETDRTAQEAGKMGKSKGASPFRELLRQHHPETLRMFLLSSHYRRPIYFSEARIGESETSLEKFHLYFRRYERLTGASFFAIVPKARREQPPACKAGSFEEQFANHRSRFLEAMDDDFNTGGAIGDLFELLRTLNKYIDVEKLEAGKPTPEQLANLRTGTELLRELSALLGLFRAPREATASAADNGLVDGLMKLLIELRSEARKSKNFALGDRIRDGLTELKITLQDRPDGTDWTVES
jgi:cysteinyl-tRNA synthetase